jgi:hypothetical protein
MFIRMLLEEGAMTETKMNATLKANATALANSQPLTAEAEAERRALNRAFRAMGLAWYWEVGDYRELQDSGDTAARVRRYVETRHAALLTAYDGDFLGRMVSEILHHVRAEYAQQLAPGLQTVTATSTASSTAGKRGWTPGSHSVDFVA